MLSSDPGVREQKKKRLKKRLFSLLPQPKARRSNDTLQDTTHEKDMGPSMAQRSESRDQHKRRATNPPMQQPDTAPPVACSMTLLELNTPQREAFFLRRRIRNFRPPGARPLNTFSRQGSRNYSRLNASLTALSEHNDSQLAFSLASHCLELRVCGALRPRMLAGQPDA